MRSLLAVTTMAMAALLLAVVARSDVITIGHARFDFDAPSPPLSAGEHELFQRFKDAVNKHDKAALMALQDSSIKRCTLVAHDVILRDLGTTIPDNAKVRFFASTGDIANEMGFGDLAYLSAQPTAVLGIMAKTGSEKELKSVTILRPVRQVGNNRSLIPYCLTPKGAAILEKKSKGQH